MRTPAQIAATIANAQSSTGPRTDEGKATVSQNALKAGLFAAFDFIRPGEEPIYKELEEMLEEELAPVGILERNVMGEIFSAMWRLRRCRVVEGTFAAQLAAMAADSTEQIPDPIQNEATAKFQASVDRARSQNNRLLHKCTSELRRLQTERHFRNEVLPEGTTPANLGVCDFSAVMKGSERAFAARRRVERQETEDLLTKVEDEARWISATQSAEQSRAAAAESAPTEPQIARGALCPCKSGEKYKRCCGKDAPPVLQQAA